MLHGKTKEGAIARSAAKIPWVVKRNTILLALSQALVGAGTQLIPAVGPLISVELLGSAALAGMAVSMMFISRLAVAYPLGKIMDVYGRRVGLVLGLAVAIVGSVLVGYSVVWRSLPVFIVGMLIFGLGMSAAQQLRLAAADMYPTSRRAEGLGYVLTGALVGALGGPVIVGVAEFLSSGLGMSPLATSWLIMPGVILPTLVLISRLRPDPKEIATHLDRYYPGYKPDLPSSAGEQGTTGIGAFLRHPPKLVAFVLSFAAQGNMATVMAISSLALAHSGHSLPSISLSVAFHVIGMFGFSLPLGRLCDVVGRSRVLALGIAISIFGAIMVPASPDWWVITLGTSLVGLGWSCVNIAATAVIADTSQPHERGRAIGTNDAFASAAGIVLPLLAGPLVDAFGLNSIGVLGVLVMIAPLPLLLRLREPSPGRYEGARVEPEKV